MRSLPSRAELAQLAQRMEASSPQEILAWALDAYQPRIVLACSFGGPTGMALLDMALRLDPSVPVFYLDTGLLFPETYALVDEVARRYGITPRAVRPGLSLAAQAEAHGEALWARDPDRCCALRKVLPQREALSGCDAWITGLRRDQSATRRATPAVAWDSQFGLVKVCPLAGWGEREVWRYIAEHQVPYNALHGRGYPSIGCTPCTRPVAAGEEARAGRWSGFAKTECGLHIPAADAAFPVGSWPADTAAPASAPDITDAIDTLDA
jgi:phosphoadenosine phosphosulfate reductase